MSVTTLPVAIGTVRLFTVEWMTATMGGVAGEPAVDNRTGVAIVPAPEQLTGGQTCIGVVGAETGKLAADGYSGDTTDIVVMVTAADVLVDVQTGVAGVLVEAGATQESAADQRMVQDVCHTAIVLHAIRTQARINENDDQKTSNNVRNQGLHLAVRGRATVDRRKGVNDS